MEKLKIGDRVACNVIDLKRSSDYQNAIDYPELIRLPFSGEFIKIYDVNVLIYGEIIDIYDAICHFGPKSMKSRQVMIKTKNGLKFHSPIEYWRKI